MPEQNFNLSPPKKLIVSAIHYFIGFFHLPTRILVFPSGHRKKGSNLNFVLSLLSSRSYTITLGWPFQNKLTYTINFMFLISNTIWGHLNFNRWPTLSSRLDLYNIIIFTDNSYLQKMFIHNFVKFTNIYYSCLKTKDGSLFTTSSDTYLALKYTILINQNTSIYDDGSI